MRKLIRCAFSLLMLLVTSGFAHGEIINLTGSIQVDDPSFSVQSPGTVKAYDSSPSAITVVNKTPSLCQLSGASGTYNQSSVSCIVEWKNIPAGFAQNAGSLSGVSTGPAGTASPSYAIYLSLDGKTPNDEIASGTVSISITSPDTPTLSSVDVNTGSSETNIIPLQVFTDKTATYPSITIKVTPEGYDQVVTLTPSSSVLSTQFTGCTVKAGASSCSGKFAPVLSADYGLEKFDVAVVCGGSCATAFPSTKSAGTATFEWDYRPPLATSLTAMVRQGGSTGFIKPAIQNSRSGELFTLQMPATVPYGSVQLSSDSSEVDFNQTGTAGGNSSFTYKLISNESRSATGVATIKILHDVALPAMSLPVLVNTSQSLPYTSSLGASDGNGNKISGSIPGTLSVTTDSAVPLNVDGTTLSPGQSVSQNITFSSGVPQYTVALPNGLGGTNTTATAHIEFVPDDPSLPRVIVPVNGYQVTAKMQVPLSVTAGLQSVVAHISSNCTLEEKSKIQPGSSACFVAWTLPTGMSDVAPGEASGLVSSGKNNISFDLKTIRGGQEYTLASGSAVIDATPPNFQFNLMGTPISRLLASQKVEIMDTETKPPVLCTYYTGTPIPTPQVIFNSGRIYCNLQWTHIPAGFSVLSNYAPEILQGMIQDPTDETFSAKITTILPGGATMTLLNKTFSPTVIEPEKPTIDITPMMKGPNGEFLYYEGYPTIPVTGKVGVNGSSVVETLMSGVKVGSVMPWFTGYVSRLQPPKSAPVGQIQDATVRVTYPTATNVYTDEAVKIAALPPPTIRPTISVSGDPNDVDKMNVNVAIANTSWQCYNKSCPYDASTDGAWKVTVGQYAGYKKPPANPAAPVTTDSNGVATIPYVFPAGTQRYVALAKLYSASGELLDTRTSNVLQVYSIKKSQFQGNLSASRITGRAPLATLLKYVPDNLTDRLFVKHVLWEINDGLGWKTMAEGDGPQALYQYHLFQKGEYQVRVTITNTAGVQTVTDPITIDAYELPQLKIGGPIMALIGSDQTLTAEVDGQPLDLNKWGIEWDVNGVIYHDVDTVTVHSDTPATISVKASAHLLAYPNDTEAGMFATRGIRFDKPTQVFVALKAPTVVKDDGTQYTFSATATNNLMGLTLDGTWTMPDGSVVNGTSATYQSPKRSFGPAKATFVGWYKEYPSLKDTFNVYVSQESQYLPKVTYYNPYSSGPVQAPFYGSLTLRPARYLSTTQSQGLSITQSASDGSKVVSSSGLESTFLFKQGGDVTISGSIKNASGDQVSASTVVHVLAPAPLAIAMTTTSDPATALKTGYVSIYPKVTGLSQLDRVAHWAGYIDGTQAPLTPYINTLRFPIHSPGTYNLKLTLQTQMGYTATGTLQVTVPAN